VWAIRQALVEFESPKLADEAIERSKLPDGDENLFLADDTRLSLTRHEDAADQRALHGRHVL
jgi:hypothetical protein